MVMFLLLPSPTKVANPPESPRCPSTCVSQCPMGPLVGLAVRRGPSGECPEQGAPLRVFAALGRLRGGRALSPNVCQRTLQYG